MEPIIRLCAQTVSGKIFFEEKGLIRKKETFQKPS
jgi:hypothetical protein